MPGLFKHQVLVQAEWPSAVGCSPTSVCVLSLRCQAEPTFQYLKTLEIKAGVVPTWQPCWRQHQGSCCALAEQCSTARLNQHPNATRMLATLHRHAKSMWALLIGINAIHIWGVGRWRKEVGLDRLLPAQKAPAWLQVQQGEPSPRTVQPHGSCARAEGIQP